MTRVGKYPRGPKALSHMLDDESSDVGEPAEDVDETPEEGEPEAEEAPVNETPEEPPSGGSEEADED